MSFKSKIHFEISERKVLLRLFDVISVLGILYLLGIIFEFNYFQITQSNFYWTIILSLYLLFFGTVFEMYNLQLASNQFQILKRPSFRFGMDKAVLADITLNILTV